MVSAGLMRSPPAVNHCTRSAKWLRVNVTRAWTPVPSPRQQYVDQCLIVPVLIPMVKGPGAHWYGLRDVNISHQSGAGLSHLLLTLRLVPCALHKVHVIVTRSGEIVKFQCEYQYLCSGKHPASVISFLTCHWLQQTGFTTTFLFYHGICFEIHAGSVW